MNLLLMLCAAFFLLAGAGVLALLGFHPASLINVSVRLFESHGSLKGECKKARKTNRNILFRHLFDLKQSCIRKGREKRFNRACIISFYLGAAGLIVPAVWNNLFLCFPLALAFSAVPFVTLSLSLLNYEKKLNSELETTLSIITNSYLRTEDFIGAVKENIPYIKRPLKEVFLAFLRDSTMISPDIGAAMNNLRDSVDNGLFREWCDCVKACFDDRTLKDTLKGIVSKLTSARLINNELKTIVSEPRKEFFSMVTITLANIPLLRLINKSWYSALVDTVQGKITLGTVAVVVLVTTVFMFKFTKPIVYGAGGERA